MEIKELLDLHKRIDSRKYHLHTVLDSNNPYWVLYKKYDDFDTYMSAENGPIMSSDTHSIEELLQYLNEHRGLRDYEFENKMNSIEDMIQRDSEGSEILYNRSKSGKMERIFYTCIRDLLFCVALLELFVGIKNKSPLVIIYAVQCTCTFLIYLFLNKAIQRYRKQLYRKEAEAWIYQKEFERQWAERVRIRNERVRE